MNSSTQQQLNLGRIHEQARAKPELTAHTGHPAEHKTSERDCVFAHTNTGRTELRKKKGDDGLKLASTDRRRNEWTGDVT